MLAAVVMELKSTDTWQPLGIDSVLFPHFHVFNTIKLTQRSYFWNWIIMIPQPSLRNTFDVLLSSCQHLFLTGSERDKNNSRGSVLIATGQEVSLFNNKIPEQRGQKDTRMIFYRVFRGDNRQMEQLAVYRVLLLFPLQGRHMSAPGPSYSKKKRT